VVPRHRRCGFAQTFHQLFAARIMVGVGEATLSRLLIR
jgi:hypothetical protein